MELVFIDTNKMIAYNNGLDIEIEKFRANGFNLKKFNDNYEKGIVLNISDCREYLDYYEIVFTCIKDGKKGIFEKIKQFNSIEELKNYCKSVTMDKLIFYPIPQYGENEIPF